MNEDKKIHPKQQALLEGIISIESAIKSGKREILTVLADKEKYEKRDRKAVRFISMLKKNSIDFKLCDRSYIDSVCEGETHGGFVAAVTDRSYHDFEAFLDELQKGGYAVFLDGVEDPFNFGYSIRNLFAFGCKGFIVPERNWMSAANTVAKASAGASELCDIAIAPSDEEALKAIKAKDIDIVCAGLSKESVSLREFRNNKPFILFIGGEKRGISKLFFENADTVLHIPYVNPDASYSLPTASCAAIFGSYFSQFNI